MNDRLMIVNDPLIQWAAGLFEGEGNARLAGSPRLKVAMTDEDVVRRFHSVVGCGKVTGPYHPGGGRKEVWTWTATGEDAVTTAARLLPWLCSRRAQAIIPLIHWRRSSRRRLVAACGTPSGLMRHYRLHEPVCDDCRVAHNSKQREYWARRRAS